LARAEETSGLETDVENKAGRKRRRKEPIYSTDSDSNVESSHPVTDKEVPLRQPPVPKDLNINTHLISCAGQCSFNTSRAVMSCEFK